MPNNYRDIYLGKENFNNQGYPMKIIEYKNYDNIIVEFAEPYHCYVKAGTGSFLKGGIVNPYAPTICGIGIVGNKYSTVIENSKGNHCREYQSWSNMIKRCYDDKHIERNPSYKDVEIDPVWFYYENYYEWIHNQTNYESVKDIDYGVDKDILIKGNKLYAPDRCTIVPRRVNNLLLKSNSIRGEYPIGVFYHKRNKTYIAQCGGTENYVYLGSFNTPLEAFNTYKEYKENMIRKVATEEYTKGTITKQCYDALMNYQVEITD